MSKQLLNIVALQQHDGTDTSLLWLTTSEQTLKYTNSSTTPSWQNW